MYQLELISPWAGDGTEDNPNRPQFGDDYQLNWSDVGHTPSVIDLGQEQFVLDQDLVAALNEVPALADVFEVYLESRGVRFPAQLPPELYTFDAGAKRIEFVCSLEAIGEVIKAKPGADLALFMKYRRKNLPPDPNMNVLLVKCSTEDLALIEADSTYYILWSEEIEDVEEEI